MMHRIRYAGEVLLAFLGVGVLLWVLRRGVGPSVLWFLGGVTLVIVAAALLVLVVTWLVHLRRSPSYPSDSKESQKGAAYGRTPAWPGRVLAGLVAFFLAFAFWWYFPATHTDRGISEYSYFVTSAELREIPLVHCMDFETDPQVPIRIHTGFRGEHEFRQIPGGALFSLEGGEERPIPSLGIVRGKSIAIRAEEKPGIVHVLLASRDRRACYAGS